VLFKARWKKGYVTENGEEVVSSYWITLRKQQEIEGGRTRHHSVENSFWKRVWTCPKMDTRMNEGHLVTWFSETIQQPIYRYVCYPNPFNCLQNSQITRALQKVHMYK